VSSCLLDAKEGECYTEPMNEDVKNVEIENIYNNASRKEDYASPTMDGELSWRCIYLFDMDSRDAPERWHNRLYGASNMRRTNITNYLQWIGSEINNQRMFDGTKLVETFLEDMDKNVHEAHKF